MPLLSRLRRQVEPYELAAALRRAASRARLVLREGEILVPDRYTLRLASRDAGRLFPYREGLSVEFAEVLSEDASAEGWSFPSPVQVTLVEDPSLAPGAFVVEHSVDSRSRSTLPAQSRSSAPASSPLLRLRVRSPEGTFDRTLAPGTLVVGRSDGVDLKLSDPAVSRRHGRLEVSPSGVSYEDLGSANGSRLNGRRVSTASLSPGDVLELGSTRLELGLSR